MMPKNYVGWACSKCNTPVAGPYAECPNCHYKPTRKVTTVPEPKKSHWLVTFRTANDHPIGASNEFAETPIEAIKMAMETVKGWVSEDHWKTCTTIKAEWMA